MPPASTSGPKVVIVLMGATGAGKSTFIQYATGHEVVVSHGVEAGKSSRENWL